MKKNYITSKKYTSSKISFGFFTRQGGFSSKKFSSLNCSYSTDVQDIAVQKNILQAQKELLLDKKKIKFVNQIHSNKIAIINKNNFLNRFQADGMITQDKTINIAVLTADCCPIFLFDDENTFVSCLHVGWKGVHANIIKNALNKIIKIQPNISKIQAIIGPCLNRKNFEVSKEFKKNFIKINSNYENYFTEENKFNKNLFDMRNLIKFQLLENKLMKIDDVDIDTYENKDLFFSHRRSTHLNQLPTGRMINIIGFKNKII
tara:strand:- start:26 stop:808 length:783 start_codon:yes stop_codon:yes gene_type:complete